MRSDALPMKEILPYDTTQVEPNTYLQIYGTNPLLKIETASRANQTFLVNYPIHTLLFSVTRLQARLYDQHGQAINHDPNVLLQTQDLPPVYEENSCVYIFTRENLERRRNRLGERPLLFEMDAAEAWDIDEELDFAITGFLMGYRKKCRCERSEETPRQLQSFDSRCHETALSLRSSHSVPFGER